MPKKFKFAASGIEQPQGQRDLGGATAPGPSGPPEPSGAGRSSPLLKRRAAFLKRTLDLICGGLLVLVFSPLFLLIPVLIKLDSPGPVFYLQKRLGPAGSQIVHIKYRTMTQDAEGRLADMLRENDHVRREFTAYHKLLDDPRLTRAGRALRRHSLDEIPQLWQVLAGTLSLVGPRAYLPEELEEMGLYADEILAHRPGLTGWWQVNGRNTVTFQDRLALDLYYIHNWSPGMELAILLKTIRVVITGQGA